MKKLLAMAACAAILSFSASAFAQDRDTLSANDHYKKGAEKTGKDIKKGAQKVGDKTSETAAKTAAKVKDNTYKDKVGPLGQTVYIDEHSKYYYIDDKGHKVYVTQAQLKDKPNK